MLPTLAYVRATSLAQAVEQLAAPGARVQAGGTDLIGCLRDGAMKVDRLVSLGRLQELRGISTTSDGGLRLGALTTITEIHANAVVREKYAALAQAASVVASPQLRNQGTLGGNLCQRPRCWYFRGDYDCARKGGDVCYAMAGENHYHAIFGGSGCFIVHPSDTAPALVALAATARIAGPKGTRAVPLEKLFVGPGEDLSKETVLQQDEILVELLLPPAPAAARSVYRKVRARGSWDFALAGIAVALTAKDGKVETARVVLSGVAPVPWRSTAVERAIVGQRLDSKTIGRAADAAVLGAEPMQHNGYKVPLVRGLVEEVLASILA